jgi:hypothetical protein
MESNPERELRAKLIGQQFDVYSKAMWSVNDLAVVMDVSIPTARKYFNKVKADILKTGKQLDIHGKIPKGDLIQMLGIDLQKEIKYINLIKQTV